jgi:eukaryotic-like serine/threonine-protein kinase
MPICVKCKKEWPAGTKACPDDGLSLTMEVDATYHPPVTPGSATASRAAVVPAGAASAALAVAEAPAYDDAPLSTELVAGMIVGEYKIDKKIGEGGMGAVYSATHPMIGKRAAIKVISAALGTDASAVNRFVQEARSVNQIGHPNIVDVFAFGELPDGRNYFVMEYLHGESLADRIGRVAMPLGEAVEILDQVADALEAAHEKQIVHRDLKPDNVYLASVRGGRTLVKLLDFGIAKLSSPDGPGSGGVQKTRTGMMMGTPGYLSPEQARGKNVDHRTDIYALGCMVFEIVCGRLPFVADNAMDIVLMHMTEPAVRASNIWPDIPPQLDDVIAKMLEKDPNARPSLAEVRAVFSELVTSGLVTLNNGRGIAFGSGISRVATPAAGLPRPTTQQAMAVGTQPATPAPGTMPPGAAAQTMAPVAEAPRKKTGLIVAIAGVALVGGAGAVFALKGGSEKAATPQPAPVVAAAPVPTPTPTPTPPPPEAKPVEKVVEAPKPGTIAIVLNVDNAEVTVDGKPVEVTGKSATASVEAAGDHLVMVNAAGREPYEATVSTKPGETSRVIAKLERATTTSKKTTATAKTGTGKTGTGKTTTTATTPATTTTTTVTPTTKPADTNKDAPIDPF